MNSENCENILKEILDEMREMEKVQKGMRQDVGKMQTSVDSSSDTFQKMRNFQTGWGAAPNGEAKPMSSNNK